MTFVTWGFFYLIAFLGGFTLALVSGLVRRLIHPSELCDHVVVPSHEHWESLHTPKSDLLVSFITIFGLVTFLVHGFTSLDAAREIAIGAVAGLVGANLLWLWMRRCSDPSRTSVDEDSTGTVVRDIPARGFGQVKLNIAGTTVKLAARSTSQLAIPAGAVVNVLECRDSVVLVEPAR